jgi:signal recognition particle receptor subunit beta
LSTRTANILHFEVGLVSQCSLLLLNACCAACVAGVVLCVVQDLPGALSDAQVAEALGLADIRNRDWAIFKTSAIKGDGLFEGLDWLANTLKARGR